MKVLYQQTASDDIVRQFRYYLLTADAPEIAVRFREAVRRTIQSLAQNPLVGPRYSSSNPRVQNLRSWPVAGFEAIRIYYSLETDTMHITPVPIRPFFCPFLKSSQEERAVGAFSASMAPAASRALQARQLQK